MRETEASVKVSIIVPVYNVESYLLKCLDSIEKQTMEDFEAILINDGSTDRSGVLAREFVKNHARFRIVEKENGGLSSARNLGLAEAKGRYVAFIDSDDFIEPDYLLRMYSAAEEQDADVACCNFSRYFPSHEISSPHLLTMSPGVYDSPAVINGLLRDTVMQSYIWNKLWRRSLFTEHGILFPDGCFEDKITLRLFYFSKKIVILPNALYHYTQRSGSIVHTLNAQSTNDFLGAFAGMRGFLEKQGDFTKYRPYFRYYTLKSILFVWGVVFQMGFRERCFCGTVGNLRRTYHYLSYYGGDGFSSEESGYDCSKILRRPSAEEERLRESI